MSGMLKGTITVIVSAILIFATVVLVKLITGSHIPVLWLALGATLFGIAYGLQAGILGKSSSLLLEAYHRICYEDMAYWGGALSGPAIRWGGWVGGFFLSLLFTVLFVLMPIGIATGIHPVWIVGSIGLVIYCLVQVLTAKST